MTEIKLTITGDRLVGKSTLLNWIKENLPEGFEHVSKPGRIEWEDHTILIGRVIVPLSKEKP